MISSGNGEYRSPRAQAGLHVGHRDAQEERGQRGGEGGGGVALHHHHVRLLGQQDRPHAGDDPAADVEQVLAGPHQVQVDIGGDAEKGQHLVEHLPVLGGDADAHPENGALAAQPGDDRGQLDGFRPGSQHHQYMAQAARHLSLPCSKNRS